MTLRAKLEQWRAAMHHPSREVMATGANTARLPELEVLLVAIVERLDEVAGYWHGRADGAEGLLADERQKGALLEAELAKARLR